MSRRRKKVPRYTHRHSPIDTSDHPGYTHSVREELFRALHHSPQAYGEEVRRESKNPSGSHYGSQCRAVLVGPFDVLQEVGDKDRIASSRSCFQDRCKGSVLHEIHGGRHAPYTVCPDITPGIRTLGLCPVGVLNGLPQKEGDRIL